MFRVLGYLLFCLISRLLVRASGVSADDQVEILVLRHQVKVLERQLGAKARYRPGDRAVLNRRHLQAILREYVAHYNERRPHRGLDLGVPSGRAAIPPGPVRAEVIRHDVLGGLVHEYETAPA
jgi:hypothetical protein